MGKEVPKPFLEIAGKSILGHTLNCFKGIDELSEVIVVTSTEYIAKAREIVSEEMAQLPFKVIEGGRERQDSVLKALNVVSDESGLVAVHDAVRPFLTKGTIMNCLLKASDSSVSGAIVAVPSRDTVKKIADGSYIVETPDRSVIWLAQTPQIFKKAVLEEAYRSAVVRNIHGTDDASLVEEIGKKVAVIEGEIQNFKITYPLDLQLASIILSGK